MSKYLVTMTILLLLLLTGTTAQNAVNAVTIQEQDFTGDGTLDVKMDNGMMWLQVNRDTPSGAKGFIDAGGTSGGPNLLGWRICSNGMVDQIVYWQPESYAIDIVENSPDRGILRVTVVDTANGKEITRKFTITLQGGAQNSWIDYLFTNTGASSFYYDENPGNIHDGAYLAHVQSAELDDIDAYINGVGTVGLTSFTWWHSYTPNQLAPFATLYRPSSGDAITYGFKSWDYPIHQVMAYYTGASILKQPHVSFMASAFTLDPGASAGFTALLAFHDGGYLEGIDLYNQATQPPVVSWCDDFESSDWTQNWHGSGNVSGISVDNTTAYTGTQSLRMFGQLGSCWAAVATHPMQMDLPLEISFAVKNGSETLSGCNPQRALLILRTGPDWWNCPCYGLLRFMPNGDVLISQQTGDVLFSGYPLGTWHAVRGIIFAPDDGLLHVKFWVNGGYLGDFTWPYESWMSGMAYLDITALEGTAWFDDVCVAPAPPPPPPPLQVYVDIKPRSCPNLLNLNFVLPYKPHDLDSLPSWPGDTLAKVLPGYDQPGQQAERDVPGHDDPYQQVEGDVQVAILGTNDFDVSTIEPSSIMLQGVPALRWIVRDVATPFAEECECNTLGADGYLDLTLTFGIKQLIKPLDDGAKADVNAIGPVELGDTIPLTISGELSDGTPIEGRDCVVIVGGRRLSSTQGASIGVMNSYPNPFNPATTIEFGLPTAGQMKLEVFNTLGQKVKTLIDAYMTAGTHSIEWNSADDSGNRVASGIYLYRIQAGEFTETKKMVLMK